MAPLDSSDGAFKYCETIAKVAIAFPDKVKRSIIERLILSIIFITNLHSLSEEPEWLLELWQLHRTKFVNANNNGEPEQHMASTSNDVVSEIQDESHPMIPAPQALDLEPYHDTDDLDGMLESTMWTKTNLNISYNLNCIM